MALSITDGTRQTTLNILSEMVGIPVSYARIFARWVTRDNHPGGSFTATMSLYVEDNPPPDKIAPLHYEIGCTLPSTAIVAMAETDDRAILYRHVEYAINFQAAQRVVAEDESIKVEQQQALDELSDALGIESILTL